MARVSGFGGTQVWWLRVPWLGAWDSDSRVGVQIWGLGMRVVLRIGTCSFEAQVSGLCLRCSKGFSTYAGKQHWPLSGMPKSSKAIIPGPGLGALYLKIHW